MNFFVMFCQIFVFVAMIEASSFIINKAVNGFKKLFTKEEEIDLRKLVRQV